MKMNYRMQKQIENVKDVKMPHITQMQQPNKINNLNIRNINNEIYFYELIQDESMLQLKQNINNLNKMLDIVALQINTFGSEFEPNINLHIATNGGCAFSSMHIYDFIKNNKYPINTYIDGFAASGGTIMFLAGKKRYMSQNSFILIHQLRTWFTGTFTQLENEFQSSSKTMQKLKKIYLDELNISRQDLQQMLKKDLWITKEQATDIGFLKN